MHTGIVQFKLRHITAHIPPEENTVNLLGTGGSCVQPTGKVVFY